MQLHPQAEALVATDRRYFGEHERVTDFAVGFVGEPRVKIKASFNVYSIGEVVKVESYSDKQMYYYEVKEYKDGWWRMEWPD